MNGRLRSVGDVVGRLRSAAAGLLTQEFTYSTGHLATILQGCLFAPSVLTFWFVNGLVDFSTAVAIGAVATPAGLQVRVVAYVLLVPTFLLARAAVHLVHPVHRKQVLSGSCPNTRLLSLDWISMGILATGLPLALRNLGPWLGMNTIFVAGVFLLPRVLPKRQTGTLKLAAIVLGVVTFVYATYGDTVATLPDPATTLGPVATLTLDDTVVERLFRTANSVTIGPPLVATVGVGLNRVLTRPELTDIPLVRYSLPKRDRDLVVAANAAFGTAFYLFVVAVSTRDVILFP
ncbi:hypothetical protein H5V44_15290 [Halobellus sp. MBLA0160]|uniref:Uncharacterized protein n=1 Tax=Halobellus ruber TaxID=2761102 RepID=A0A7J9SM64_9EURY|nr:hypothetical protein [Halobellus ruber]